MTDTTNETLPSLYKDGSFHTDEWQFLSEDTDYVGQPKTFAPLAVAINWLEEGANSGEAVGVLVEPGDDVETLKPFLDRIAVVAINFPAFSDGRGFSSARLLKERLGYSGEVRAVGAYILDQMPFLSRCGVDSFHVSSAKVRAGLERGEWPEVENYYQPVGSDGSDVIASRPWLRAKAV